MSTTWGLLSWSLSPYRHTAAHFPCVALALPLFQLPFAMLRFIDIAYQRPLPTFFFFVFFLGGWVLGYQVVFVSLSVSVFFFSVFAVFYIEMRSILIWCMLWTCFFQLWRTWKSFNTSIENKFLCRARTLRLCLYFHTHTCAYEIRYRNINVCIAHANINCEYDLKCLTKLSIPQFGQHWCIKYLYLSLQAPWSRFPNKRKIN